MSTFKIYLTVFLANVILNVEVRAISSDEEEEEEDGFRRIEYRARTPPDLLPHQTGEMPHIEFNLDMYDYFPYLVYLGDLETGGIFCGGSILSNRHILTAASCFKKKIMRKIYVIVYQPSVPLKDSKYYIKEIEVHKQYRPVKEGHTALYDIAILILNREIQGQQWRQVEIGVENDISESKYLFGCISYYTATVRGNNVITTKYERVLSSSTVCSESYPSFSTEWLCIANVYNTNDVLVGSPYIAINGEQPYVIGISLKSKTLWRYEAKNSLFLFTNAVIHKPFIQEILFKYFNEKH